MDSTISEISKELGLAAGKQAELIVTNEAAQSFVDVIAIDQGVHPISGQPFK